MNRLFLPLVVALAVGGCNEPPFDYDLYEHQPAAQLKLDIHAHTETQLESVLHEFAEKNGFSLRVARVHPTEPRFRVMMWRKDTMILGSNPFNAYKFGFFPAKGGPIDADSIEHLRWQLEGLVRS